MRGRAGTPAAIQTHIDTPRTPTPEGACHYFVYSALIHDRLLRWRRHVIRELLLMMNWRVVAAPHAPLNTKIFASWLGVSGEWRVVSNE